MTTNVAASSSQITALLRASSSELAASGVRDSPSSDAGTTVGMPLVCSVTDVAYPDQQTSVDIESGHSAEPSSSRELRATSKRRRMVIVSLPCCLNIYSRKARMREPKWREDGSEPDYRFSLANERTFLAWIRTALAILAGGVLLAQFSTKIGPHWVIVTLAILLAVLSAVLAGIAYARWRANEIAMRHGRRLPMTVAVPLISAVVLAVAAVIAVLLVVF
jgi:putative membrane protein